MRFKRITRGSTTDAYCHGPCRKAARPLPDAQGEPNRYVHKMDEKKPKIFLGCVIAPLFAPLTMLLIILLFGEDLRGPGYKYDLKDLQQILGIAWMFIVFGAPIAYAITIVLGLPYYFIIKKLNFINYWSVTLGSAFIAIFPILVVFARSRFVLYDDPKKSSLLFYLAIASCGYVVGLVFWFVSGLNKKSAHNKRLHKDAYCHGPCIEPARSTPDAQGEP